MKYLTVKKKKNTSETPLSKKENEEKRKKENQSDVQAKFLLYFRLVSFKLQIIKFKFNKRDYDIASNSFKFPESLYISIL